MNAREARTRDGLYAYDRSIVAVYRLSDGRHVYRARGKLCQVATLPQLPRVLAKEWVHQLAADLVATLISVDARFSEPSVTELRIRLGDALDALIEEHEP